MLDCRSNRFWITFIVMTAGGWQMTFSADEPVKKITEKEAFQAHAKAAAAAYSVQIVAEPPIELLPQNESVLRWANPVGGKETHGEVFLWTDRGRPEVILSLYEFIGAGDVLREHHEFCSLSNTKVAAKMGDKSIWAPTEAGVQMKPISDSAPPGDSARTRLREMRTLAAQFTADKTTREDVTRDLRLLTQPLYRYEGTHPDVLDGAVFAFVESTDPEILLIIEATRKGEGHEWTYALARLNSIRMRAFHNDNPVWEAPLLPWRDALDRPDKPYTALRIR